MYLLFLKASEQIKTVFHCKSNGCWSQGAAGDEHLGKLLAGGSGRDPHAPEPGWDLPGRGDEG